MQFTQHALERNSTKSLSQSIIVLYHNTIVNFNITLTCDMLLFCDPTA